MSNTLNRNGSCQCGEIQYQLTGDPLMFYACHCLDCQNQSGSAHGLSLIVRPSQVQFLQGGDKIKYWETHADSGAIKRCAFCPDCGTRIYHGSDNENETMSFKAGTLNESLNGQIKPVAHIWLKSAQPWVVIDEGQFLCYRKGPEDDAAMKTAWRKQLELNS